MWHGGEVLLDGAGGRNMGLPRRWVHVAGHLVGWRGGGSSMSQHWHAGQRDVHAEQRDVHAKWWIAWPATDGITPHVQSNLPVPHCDMLIQCVPPVLLRHPWEQRQPVLYSNPGNYHRYTASAATQKMDHKDARTETPRKAIM
jgi:hypothetical protein